MTCPKCQKELPEDHKGKKCPFCGASTTRINWRVFFCALLFPPVLTLISAMPLFSRTNGYASFIVALLGSVVGGIVCGVTLGLGKTDSTPGDVALSILLSGVMIIVCLMLCFFGCAFSNLVL